MFFVLILMSVFLYGCAEEEVQERTESTIQEEASTENLEITMQENIPETIEESSVVADEMEETVSEEIVETATEYKVGDLIYLGRRHLDDDYSAIEKLEWIILDIKDNQALVYSTQTVVAMAHGAYSWKDSQIREWLNNYFYYCCFNDSERALLIERTSDDLEITSEKIFCLSMDEYAQYAENTGLIDGWKESYFETENFQNTNYERNQYGNSVFEKSNIVSRTFGKDMHSTKTLYKLRYDGSIGQDVAARVNPAMWIDLSKDHHEEETNTVELQYNELALDSTFTFGEWEQDFDYSNGSEAVEWRIIDIQDDFITARAEKGLDANYFSTEEYGWANDVFYYQAFSEKERGYIVDKKIENRGYSPLWYLNREEAEYYNISIWDYEDTPYCKFRKNYTYVDTFGENVTTQEERNAAYAEIVNREEEGTGYRPCIQISIDAFNADNSVETVARYEVGEEITLGKYEQDNNMDNGSEDIEWVVADTYQGKALLVSKYILDQQVYGEVDGSDNVQNQWIDSTLRTWLNNDFYNSAFSEQEKGIILPTLTSERDSLNDNVFIISREELLDTKLGVAETTAYARAQGVYGLYVAGIDAREGYYWLRPSDELSVVSHPAEVLIETYTKEVERKEILWAEINREDIGVRPAIWIKVE